MFMALKYNSKSGGLINGQTWQIFNVETGEILKETDHVDLLVNSKTGNRMYNLGFSLLFHGKILEKRDRLTGKHYAVIIPDGVDDSYFDLCKPELDRKKYQSNNLVSIKYHVPSKGLMQNDSWRIYNKIQKNWTDTTYVDEVDIQTWSWTGENLFNVGFSQIFEGHVHLLENVPITVNTNQTLVRTKALIEDIDELH